MTTIIIEGVLFIALVSIAAALVVFVVRHYTAAGRLIEQTRNRKEIERIASRTCGVHGVHEEREMVRLESGEVMCPECYRDVMEGRA